MGALISAPRKSVNADSIAAAEECLFLSEKARQLVRGREGEEMKPLRLKGGALCWEWNQRGGFSAPGHPLYAPDRLRDREWSSVYSRLSS